MGRGVCDGSRWEGKKEKKTRKEGGLRCYLFLVSYLAYPDVSLTPAAAHVMCYNRSPATPTKMPKPPLSHLFPFPKQQKTTHTLNDNRHRHIIPLRPPKCLLSVATCRPLRRRRLRPPPRNVHSGSPPSPSPPPLPAPRPSAGPSPPS